MLPLHRKKKLDDVELNSFPYRFARPVMISRTRRRLNPRKIHVGGFLIVSFVLWLIFRSGDFQGRYKSPYALASQHTNDTRPIVDIRIQECTRWSWFESKSKCMALLKEGWEISGGDLLLDTGKNRLHLFVKRHPQGKRDPVITKLRVSQKRPGMKWEGRQGGLWRPSISFTGKTYESFGEADSLHQEDPFYLVGT